MSKLLRFDCPVSFREQDPDDVDASKGIRCSLAAYNGGVMGIKDYGDVIVDTAGVKAAAQTPLLSDHDSSLGGVVGYANVQAKEGRLLATGYVVPSTDAAKQIVALARAGFSFQASIGLELEDKEQIQPDALVQRERPTDPSRRTWPYPSPAPEPSKKFRSSRWGRRQYVSQPLGTTEPRSNHAHRY